MWQRLRYICQYIQVNRNDERAADSMADSRGNEHREPSVLALRAFHGHRHIEADGYLMSLMVMPILMAGTASKDRQPRR
ncbi:hypothetical protein JZ00_02440 [Pseudomonas frederiksbergensis]|uniref:Uncharacterized protein n=1 Tax=Pseudomonas frederiksbergensis TaxID=104087 RepID=A0A0B1ZBM8_9PSED|nr:hypothetical protein JZ00_02440 [Pseudomonas frederiksbergensis]